MNEARGASTGAGARQVAPRKDKLQSLEDRTKRLSAVLRNAVLEMMLQWASQANLVEFNRLIDVVRSSPA